MNIKLQEVYITDHTTIFQNLVKQNNSGDFSEIT